MDNYIKDLLDIIDELKQLNERLTIENKLLREASEEQRKLNGNLRMELSNEFNQYKDLNIHNVETNPSPP